MAREPKVTAPVAPSTPPAAESAATVAAATVEAIAANYGDPVVDGDPKPAGVVPVAVSIDALLEVLTHGSADVAKRTGLRVVGPMQGRRRAGRQFGPEAIIIPTILLGEDELRSIDGDPLLSWSVVQIEAPEPEDAGE